MAAKDLYWEKATLTDSSGLVKSGYVNRITDVALSFEIQFKSGINDKEIQIFLPVALSQVRFDSDNAIYEKVILVDKKTAKKEYRLLKCLLQGYCSLYRLNFKEFENGITAHGSVQNGRLVIKKENKDYILEEKESITNTVYYKKENSFWGILNYLFQDVKDKKLKAKMSELMFTESSLIGIVTYYNQLKSPDKQSVIYVEKNKKIKKIGLFAETYRVKDDTKIFNPSTFGLYYESQKPEKSRHRSNIIGVGLVTYPKTSIVLPMLQLGMNYYFHPQRKITLYVGGGVIFHSIAPPLYANIGIKTKYIQTSINAQYQSVGARLSINLDPRLK